MAELYTTGTAYKVAPQGGLTVWAYETPSTADGADTVTITLGSVGMAATGVLGVQVLLSTASGIWLPETYADHSSCAVSSGVLTVTLGSGTNNQRLVLVYGKGQPI